MYDLNSRASSEEVFRSAPPRLTDNIEECGCVHCQEEHIHVGLYHQIYDSSASLYCTVLCCTAAHCGKPLVLGLGRQRERRGMRHKPASEISIISGMVLR